MVNKKANKTFYLRALDIYGFDKLESVVLSSLVTEDPLLLIGPSGTGKTFLLNSLSEELQLEHRHYNASLISFDDLVGFPFPEQDKSGVKFLETPATVWGAESVLIDEISRCKPEHQNRLFSLVHERRVQGIALTSLRYRWAAMNPCNDDENNEETYSGSEPLDPALADRFALFIQALDWSDLTDDERLKIADPAGEGKVSDDRGQLKNKLIQWRAEFTRQLKDCPNFILSYVTMAVDTLNDTGVRISPRRARLISRSLLAASVVDGGMTDKLFKMVLECSLPQVAWGERVKPVTVTAAHRAAWDAASQALSGWIHVFMSKRSIRQKLRIFLDECHDPDQGTQAFAQFIASGSKEKVAALAYALYPSAVLGKLNIGAEGVNDLAKIATPMLSVNREISWREGHGSQGKPKDFERFARVLADLEGTRLERARHFFDWCLVEQVHPQDPGKLERDIHACITLLKDRQLV